MTYAFDTLNYARHLRDAGVESAEAEAHAEAARDFIMAELVTKQDLDVRLRVLETTVENVELRLESRIDNLELRLMVRLGGMLAAAVVVLAAVIKF